MIFNGIFYNDECIVMECMSNLPSLQEIPNLLTEISINNNQKADSRY